MESPFTFPEAPEMIISDPLHYNFNLLYDYFRKRESYELFKNGACTAGLISF